MAADELNVDNLIMRLLEGELLVIIVANSPENLCFSERMSAWKSCSYDRVRGEGSLPQIARDFPITANSAGVGGAAEDFW